MGVEPFLSSSAASACSRSGSRGACAATAARRARYSLEDLRHAVPGANLPPGLREPRPVYTPVGCNRCRGTGYRGRLGVYEMLVMSERLKRLAVAGRRRTRSPSGPRRRG